ncbi:MAG: NAD-dependent epimerase/dehydratase family protein [Planctomycetales bacterium]|nr:NAD-dependent epimerase/dehydratase family protein [Planctomycetales bacterium]
MIAALNQRLEQSKAPVMPRAKTIVVSGASGLVGSALWQAIGDRQWNQRRLVRRSSANDRGDGISWNPESGLLNFTGFSGTDAVLHLAGENIASGRWTAAKKLRIRDSRLIGTQRLCKSLASMPNPPRVLVCASASQMIRAF